MVTPCELFGLIADKITEVCKQPYRSAPVTKQEWDIIRDSILMLEVVDGNTDGASGPGSLNNSK